MKIRNVFPGFLWLLSFNVIALFMIIYWHISDGFDLERDLMLGGMVLALDIIIPITQIKKKK